MRTLFIQAWKLYWKHFGIIVSIVLAIWIPIVLLNIYLDYSFIDTKDTRKIEQFSGFLSDFIGIISTGAVISVGYTSSTAGIPAFASAMKVGLSSWGRLFWTRIIAGVYLLLGFLFLVVPGIYLLVRLALVVPVSVCERVSGWDAMHRSLALTKGRFWEVFLFGLALLIALILVSLCISLPIIKFPALFDSVPVYVGVIAFALAAQLILSFGTLCLFSLYTKLSTKQPPA